MTSNLGGTIINKTKRSLGFVSSEDQERTYQEIKDLVLEEVKKTFRPEFLNRVDELIVFHPLTRDHIKKIIDILLRDMRKRLAEKNMQLKLTKEAKEFLVDRGFDPVYGARPLKRAIQKYVEDPLSEELLKGKFQEGDIIVCKVSKGTLKFSKRRKTVGATG